jgi:hypothetical protein
MVLVEVKWGKEKLSLNVDLSAGASALNTQLLALTGVPVDRQKVMGGKKAWKGMLKTDAMVGELQEAAKLVLIGSAIELVEPEGLAGLGIHDAFDIEAEKLALEAVHAEHAEVALEQAEGLIHCIQKLPLDRAECDNSRTEPFAYSRLAHGYPQSKVPL